MNPRQLHRMGIAVGAAFLLTLAGCDDTNSTDTTTRRDTATPPTAPDNTGKNVRDRDEHSTTPLDQGENETDRTITQEIRKAVMAEPNMSVNAQNCKIITKDGVVTLRGPVSTQAEKDTIEAKAKAIAGVKSVVNELEVTGR